MVAAVERIPLAAFEVAARAGGKPQYHRRLMLALLIYSYANGSFSSRRIERATYRDIAVRFVAANLHPDHDAIATFRRTNKAAFEAAFLQVLLLAREAGLRRLGKVAIGGTGSPRFSPRAASRRSQVNWFMVLCAPPALRAASPAKYPLWSSPMSEPDMF